LTFISAQSGLLRHPIFSTRGLPWLKSATEVFDYAT
jgi:hypothetical protein